MSEVDRALGPADDARPQDIELYRAMLNQTRERLTHVGRILNRPPHNRVQLEECALQIRIVLEHIVLLALVSNRPATAAVVKAFDKKSAGDVHGIVRRINPDYWPVPFDYQPKEDEEQGVYWMAEPELPYLREDEWGRAYGFCSSLLHARNPYQQLAMAKSGAIRSNLHHSQAQQLEEYWRKIWRLLYSHQIFLSEAGFSLVCHLPQELDKSPRVEVYGIQPETSSRS